jgi:thiamine biosynthesis lipoprotein
VLTWLAGFEARYSRFLPDSLISRINAAAGREWVETDEELDSMFAICDWFHWMTQGIFDPSMLPLARLWDYHRPPCTLPGAGEVARALSLLGWKKVEREKGRVFLPDAGMAIDLGGVGKEYAVDRVFEMALAAGMENVMVDFGHDLRTRGEPPEGGPWRIGLEHPSVPGRCWGGVAITDRAVASSGTYQRFFEVDGERYSHILDPRTGWPVRSGVDAVSVVAPTCTEAGILSTTALILGPDEGRQLIERSAHAAGCIWSNGNRIHTRGFDDYVL